MLLSSAFSFSNVLLSTQVPEMAPSLKARPTPDRANSSRHIALLVQLDIQSCRLSILARQVMSLAAGFRLEVVCARILKSAAEDVVGRRCAVKAAA